jgi:hypothetical protein
MVAWKCRAAVGGAVGLLAFVVVACGGDDGEEAAVPTPTTAPGVLATVPAATATVANRPSDTAAPTETAALPPTVSAPGADPAEFRQFADLVARAAADGDAVFFASRVEPEPYTCTEAEVTQGGLGGAEPGLCQEAGQQVDLVLLCFWQSECVHSPPERLSEQISAYFGRALPDEEDDLASGEVRLFAVATRPPGLYEGERSLHTAILTAIAPLSGQPDREPVRTALGIDFEYVEGRWVVRGTLSAVLPENALFEGFLSPEAGPYSEVERY